MFFAPFAAQKQAIGGAHVTENKHWETSPKLQGDFLLQNHRNYGRACASKSHTLPLPQAVS